MTITNLKQYQIVIIKYLTEGYLRKNYFLSHFLLTYYELHIELQNCVKISSHISEPVNQLESYCLDEKLLLLLLKID
jgi:hypothetical protein